MYILCALVKPQVDMMNDLRLQDSPVRASDRTGTIEQAACCESGRVYGRADCCESGRVYGRAGSKESLEMSTRN